MVSNAQRLDAGEFARWWDETGDYELRQILFWRWDPINVVDFFPWTADEYDVYTARIVGAIREGASEAEIAEVLGVIERERMSLDGHSHAHRQAVAAGILKWFDESQHRWREFGPLRR